MKTQVTDTSIDAYHNHVIPRVASTSCRKVEDFVAATGGSTISEIAAGLGMDKSSVSARRNELITAKRVQLGEKRTCRVTGLTVQTVFISPKQNNLFAN